MLLEEVEAYRDFHTHTIPFIPNPSILFDNNGQPEITIDKMDNNGQNGQKLKSNGQ